MADAPPEEQRRNRQCVRCLSFMDGFMEGRVSSSLDNTGRLVSGSDYGMDGEGREESWGASSGLGQWSR